YGRQSGDVRTPALGRRLADRRPIRGAVRGGSDSVPPCRAARSRPALGRPPPAALTEEGVMKDFERYDGLALADLVRTRAVTPKELLNSAVRQIEARNPAVNAVVNRMYDKAEAAIAAGLPAGPFTGVPYLLKDLGVYYAGTITSAGSAFFRDATADHDSEIVARMKRAGLVILGKTNTSEFGLSTSVEPELFGPTRNPWNLEFSAGGSSGGAAAAVAARMLPRARPTGGGGPGRIPPPWPRPCCPRTAPPRPP